MGTNYYRKRILTKEEKSNLIKAIEEDRITSFTYIKETAKVPWETVSSKDLEIPLKVHIGKNSWGWRFLFNSNNFKFYEANKESIQQFIESGILEDEYGEQHTFIDFWENCVEKNKNKYTLKQYYHDNPQNNMYKVNSSEYEKVINELRFSLQTDFC